MVRGLSERLQKLRNDRNLSQKAVADALGISAAVVSNYESGSRTPSLEMLTSLASFYKCSTDYLLGFEKPAPQKTIDVSSLTPEQTTLLEAFIASLK